MDIKKLFPFFGVKFYVLFLKLFLVFKVLLGVYLIYLTIFVDILVVNKYYVIHQLIFIMIILNNIKCNLNENYLFYLYFMKAKNKSKYT